MRLRGAKTTESSTGGAQPSQNVMTRRKVVPTEPLHMTTRAAASKTASVATGSPNASIAAQSASASSASNDSRRSSLREVTSNVGGADIDENRPAKTARMSLRSSRRISGSNSSVSNNFGPLNEDLDSRKSSLAEHGSAEHLEPKETVETVPSQDLESSSFDQVPVPPATPSKRGSPIKRGGRGSRTLRGRLITNNAARIDSPGTPNLNFDGDLTDRQSPGRNEAGGAIERLPGRKRAQHADSEIEVDLRRQLELKVAYRAVVKALKPVLAELADRTVQEVREDEELIQTYSEYDDIIRQLDSRLEERLELLDSRFKERTDRFKTSKEVKQYNINRQFEQTVRDHRDDFILLCQHEYLTVSQEVTTHDDDNATQYEHGIIPPLYTYESVPQIRVGDENPDQEASPDQQFVRVPLSPEYDSRSRVFVETERRWDDFDSRQRLGMLLHRHDPESFVQKPKGFAVFDGETRRQATAHLNLQSLIAAGEEVEKNPEIPAKAVKPIANADASGLQALAAAVEMAPAVQTPVHPQIPSTKTNEVSPGSQVPGHYINANYKITSEPLKKPVMPPLRAETASSEGQAPRRSTTTSNPRPPYLQSRMTFGTPTSFVSPYPLPQTPQQPQTPEVQAPPPAPPSAMQRQTTQEPPLSNPRSQAALHVVSEPPSSRHANQVERQPYPDKPAQETPNLVPNPPARPPVSVADTTRALPRKRPGPRPHYSSQVEPDIAPHLHGGQPWRPFSNTMGPPTHLPKYIKGSEPTRSEPHASNAPLSSAPQITPRPAVEQRNSAPLTGQDRRTSTEQARPIGQPYVQLTQSEIGTRSLPSMRPVYVHEPVPLYGPPPPQHQQHFQQQYTQQPQQGLPHNAQPPQQSQQYPNQQQGYNQHAHPQQTLQPHAFPRQPAQHQTQQDQAQGHRTRQEHAQQQQHAQMQQAPQQHQQAQNQQASQQRPQQQQPQQQQQLHQHPQQQIQPQQAQNLQAPQHYFQPQQPQQSQSQPQQPQVQQAQPQQYQQQSQQQQAHQQNQQTQQKNQQTQQKNQQTQQKNQQTQQQNQQAQQQHREAQQQHQHAQQYPQQFHHIHEQHAQQHTGQQPQTQQQHAQRQLQPQQQPVSSRSPQSTKQDTPAPPPSSQSNQLPPLYQPYRQPTSLGYAPIAYHDTFAGRLSQPAQQPATTKPSNVQSTSPYPPLPPPSSASQYYTGHPPTTQPTTQPTHTSQLPPSSPAVQNSQTHSRTGSLPTLAPSLPPLAPDLRPHSRHDSLSHAPDSFSHAASRHLQQQPGQAGHQPILPATLDPNRRKSQLGATASTPTNGTLIPGANQAVISGLQGQRPPQHEWRNYTSILPAPAAQPTAPVPVSAAPLTPVGMSYVQQGPHQMTLPPPPHPMYQNSGPPYSQPPPHYQQHPIYPFQPHQHYLPPAGPYHTLGPSASPVPGIPTPASSITTPSTSARGNPAKPTSTTVAASGSNSRGKVREWRFQTGQGRVSRGGKARGGGSGTGTGSRKGSMAGKGGDGSATATGTMGGTTAVTGKATPAGTTTAAPSTEQGGALTAAPAPTAPTSTSATVGEAATARATPAAASTTTAASAATVPTATVSETAQPPTDTAAAGATETTTTAATNDGSADQVQVSSKEHKAGEKLS